MKAKKLLITAVAAALALLTAFSVFADGALYGDVNADGKVDTKDLTRLMKFIAGGEVEITDADLTGDGDVSAKDLTRLMKVIAGDYETSAPTPDDSDETTAPTPVTDPVDTEPIETEAPVETLPSEPEESYDIKEADLSEIFSSANASGTASEEEADAVLGSAVENNYNLTEEDITVVKTYKAVNGSVDYIYKGRGKVVIDPETYELRGAKINEYVSRDGEESTTLSYYDGEYCYVNSSESEDPYYIVGLNSMYTAMDKLLQCSHTPIDLALIEGAEIKALEGGGYYISKNFNYADLTDLVDSYVNEIMAEYSKLESPTAIRDIKLEYIVDENGYLKSSRFGFTFGITFRVDASNTRAQTIEFELAVNHNAPGAHVPIERPEGLDDYWMYDATEEILADLQMLHDENGNRIANFDFMYSFICDYYTTEEVEAVIDAYGIVL